MLLVAKFAFSTSDLFYSLHYTLCCILKYLIISQVEECCDALSAYEEEDGDLIDVGESVGQILRSSGSGMFIEWKSDDATNNPGFRVFDVLFLKDYFFKIFTFFRLK